MLQLRQPTTHRRRRDAHLLRGSGPALLMLHGHPQTSATWHKVAPALAQHFTLVLADLRGYGDSAKPAGDADHANDSKRVMATDMLAAMRELGYATFLVLALWGERGVVHRCFKPLDEWQRVASDVRGHPMPCGHYIAEEAPDRLLADVLPFLLGGR
ncbi:alpha/beta fold hydrolase [Pandoraea sp. NPDC087047]|uniref:alpha/beta fold hydrolase n=1 Tax=Pandoraea sp. NPDC087047 TaxID=3364390 RepID=UPI0038063FA8